MIAPVTMTKITAKMIVDGIAKSKIARACGDCGSSALEVFILETYIFAYPISSKPAPSARSRIRPTSGPLQRDAVSDVMSFDSRLSGYFPCYSFLLAAVKHKRFLGPIPIPDFADLPSTLNNAPG